LCERSQEQEKMKRITIRLNDVEEAELELLKKTFHIDKDSEALKLSVEWVNNYLKNVTNTFFPASYEVILKRRLKTQQLDRKVYY